LLKQNLHYFNKSIKIKENFLDNYYMFPDWDTKISEYIERSKELQELLTTIKVLGENNDKNLESYFYKLQEKMDKLSTKTEFGGFINACDCNQESIFKKENLEILKLIVNLYLEKRSICNTTPKEWIQCLIDKGSSRKKGGSGERKILDLGKKEGFLIVKNWEEFKTNKKVICKFSKGRFDIKGIKKELNIDLEFNNQNKMLDVIIKNNNKYIFIEAKHMSLSGGGQNKQILELISILRKKNKNKDVMYGCFFDGMHSNELLNISEKEIKNPALITGQDKVVAQKTDLIESLKENKNSFWFNTAGIKYFLKDFN